MGLPSKTNTTAVVVDIPEDSAGTDFVVFEDGSKFLNIIRYDAEGHVQ